jgi:1,6-anhydro-N-acetylmuramate kinase
LGGAAVSSGAAAKNPQAQLHKASWQAEKRLKQRGHFRGVLWLTERADGTRELIETDCKASLEQATDAQVLDMLAAEQRAEFVRNGIAAFAVAYAAKAHTMVNVLLVEPQTRTADVVAIEVHSVGEHLVAYREVQRSQLGPLSAPAAATASRYATVIASNLHLGERAL